LTARCKTATVACGRRYCNDSRKYLIKTLINYYY
jgi:hypothetical protein